ncbi:MAG TPA: SPOR domain-containing protein [Syntrophaceae bacterium]|nr:SPOR domain-containing protein [Syntrophaceae bacterium]
MKRARRLESLYTFEFTRKGLVLSLIGGFFILLWMFILGVLVGRYLPSPYLVAELPQEFHRETIGPRVKKEIPSPELTFHKTLFKDVDQVRVIQGYFSVQVAAFKNLESAQVMVQRLRRKGYHAYIATSEIAHKGAWHRVRVGHFKTEEQAKAFVSKISKAEGIKGVLIVKEAE